MPLVLDIQEELAHDEAALDESRHSISLLHLTVRAGLGI